MNLSAVIDVPEPNTTMAMRRIAGHQEITTWLANGQCVALLLTDEAFAQMVMLWRQQRTADRGLPVSEVALEQTP